MPRLAYRHPKELVGLALRCLARNLKVSIKNMTAQEIIAIVREQNAAAVKLLEFAMPKLRATGVIGDPHAEFKKKSSAELEEMLRGDTEQRTGKPLPVRRTRPPAEGSNTVTEGKTPAASTTGSTPAASAESIPIQGADEKFAFLQRAQGRA